MNTKRSFWRTTAFGAFGTLLATTALAENGASTQAGGTQQSADGSHHSVSAPRTMAEEGLTLDTPAASIRPAPSRATVSITHSDARQLQQALHAQLLYDGNIDGIVGPQTRAALREFQTREQLPVTGTLDDPTRLALGLEESPAAGDNAGIERQPVSGQSPGEVQRMGGSESEVVFGIPQLTGDHTREIQRQLQVHGHYAGEVDGIFGPLTRAALMAFFQAQARDVAQGRLSAEALQFFNLDPSAIQTIGSDQASGSDAASPTTGPRISGPSETMLPDQPTRRAAPETVPDPQRPNPEALPGVPNEDFEPQSLPPEGYQE